MLQVGASGAVQELTQRFHRVTLVAMKHMGKWVLAFVIGVAAGSTASAQEAAAPDPVPVAGAADAPAEPVGPTSYDFEDDLVTGDLVRPDGELLNVRRRGRRASLIRIREDFIPEMLKSVEKL
ncbi:MAG: hypothetical protein H6715_04665 [Myxococcales bacterium]|nr:hypothetical protein [Myxococcales bacterium]MCB9708423.1 hypothetical protein [Myxococcales bacterium]